MYSNTALNDQNYEEADDPNLTYFENIEFTTVDEEVFTNLVELVKSRIDDEPVNIFKT